MVPKYKCLEPGVVNPLYLHPLYGARTLEDIAEMDKIASAPKPAPATRRAYVECSFEMFTRNERHIDLHGFSM